MSNADHCSSQGSNAPRGGRLLRQEFNAASRERLAKWIAVLQPPAKLAQAFIEACCIVPERCVLRIRH
jgi:hypothetical protein